MARARSLTEFQETFPDEASCAAFLFDRRWPDGFICPVVRQWSRGGAEEPGIHLRMLRLCPADLDHGGHRAAPHQATADGLVLGRASDVDAFQRNVGAAVLRRAPRRRKTATGPRQDGSDAARTEGQNQASNAVLKLDMEEPGTTQ